MPSKEWEGVNAVLMLGKDEILYILTNKNSNLFVTAEPVTLNWIELNFYFTPNADLWNTSFVFKYAHWTIS